MPWHVSGKAGRRAGATAYLLLYLCQLDVTRGADVECSTNEACGRPVVQIASLEPSVVVVVGTYETLWYSNRTVEVFRGIPYAEAPVGNRRFAQSAPLWRLPTSPFYATNYGPACLQIYSNVSQSEDCLHLNIWRPRAIATAAATAAAAAAEAEANADAYRRVERSRRQLLPVIVMIHGGAFVVGHSRSPNYNGLPLVAAGSRDLIVVNFNYRLGPFGFVDMSDVVSGVPGNQGWHDQRLAMTWVRTHIESFGGDPNRITVLGCSAGAIAASYHLMSPLSNRLFSRVVLDAGVLSSPRRIDTARRSLQRLLRLAVKVDCVHGEASKLLRCLRAVDATRLRDASLDVMDSPLLGFRPTAASDADAKVPSDVAVLMGHSGDEGLSLVSNGFGINDPLPTLRNVDEGVLWCKTLLATAMPHAQARIEANWPSIARLIENLYFAGSGGRSGPASEDDAPVGIPFLVDAAALFVADLFFHCNMLDFYQRTPNATFYVFKRAFADNIEWDVNPRMYRSFHMTAHMHFVGSQLITMKNRIHRDDLAFSLKAMRWLSHFVWFGKLANEFPSARYPEIVSIRDQTVTLDAHHPASRRCSQLMQTLIWLV